MFSSYLLSLAPLLVSTLAGTVINGIDVDADFRHPVAGEVRTPCPMLNALSNHGFISRSGYNISRDQLVPALTEIAGFQEDIAGFLFEAGMSTTDNPNGTSFDYNDVNQHNLLEHDGSLSRSDFFFGDAVSFSKEAFAQTKSHFTDELVDLPHAAAAHVSRMDLSNSTNPAFELTDVGDFNSLGETLLYFSVLGSKEGAYQVERSMVEYFFEQERLPFPLGWTPQPRSISGDFVTDGIREMASLTGRNPVSPVDDDDEGEQRVRKRHVAHFGRGLSV